MKNRWKISVGLLCVLVILYLTLWLMGTGKGASGLFTALGFLFLISATYYLFIVSFFVNIVIDLYQCNSQNKQTDSIPQTNPWSTPTPE